MEGQDSFYSSFVKAEVKDLFHLSGYCGPRQAEFGSLIDNKAYDLRGNLVWFGLSRRLIDQAG